MLNTLVRNLIVNAAFPFSLLEHPDFKALIDRGFPGRHLDSRPTLMSRLQHDTANMKQKLVQQMKCVSYVATTADCWFVHKRYMYRDSR